MRLALQRWVLLGGVLAGNPMVSAADTTMACEFEGCTNSLFTLAHDDAGYHFRIHEQVAEYLPLSDSFSRFLRAEGVIDVLDRPEAMTLTFAESACAQAFSTLGDVACHGAVTVTGRVLGGFAVDSDDPNAPKRTYTPYQLERPMAPWTADIRLVPLDRSGQGSSGDYTLRIRIVSKSGRVFDDLDPTRLWHCL